MHLEVPHHSLEHHRLSPAAASSPLLGDSHHDGNSSDYFVHAASREQAANASSPVTPTASRPRAPRTPSVFATPNVPATIEEGSEPGSPVKRRFSGSPRRDDEIDSDGDSTKSGVKSEGSHPRIVEPDQAERQPSIMDLVSAAPSPEREGRATTQGETASAPVAEVKLHPKPSMNDIAFPRADTQDEPAPPPPLPASTSPPPSSSSEATTSPSTGDRGDASPQLRHQLSLSPSSSTSPLRRFIRRSFSRSSSNSMRSEAASTTSSSSPNVVRHNAQPLPQPQDDQKPASPSKRRQLLPAPPARDSSLRENRRRRRSSASLHDDAATASPATSPPQEARTRRLSASLPKSWRKRLSSLSIRREGKTPARLSLASLFDRSEVVASHDDSSSELQQEEADLLAALEGEAAWLNGQGSLGRAKSVNVPATSQDSAPSPSTASQATSISRPFEPLSPPAKSRPLLRRKHAQQLPEPLASRPASVGSSTIRGHRQSTASSIRPPSLPTTPMTIAPPPPPPPPLRSLTRKRSMSHSGVTRLRPELRELGQTGKGEGLATNSPPSAWRFHATDMAPSRSLPIGEWTSALELDLGQSTIEDDAATTILSDGASASPETPRRPRLASLNRPTQSHESALPRTLRARLRLSQQESTLPPPVEFNVEVERRRSISERATRPRPTSLVLGPFDLQVPEMPAANDETSKEALRSLRHRSLPAALNIREKVLARRQYRRLRRSVDLALGLSVPLQLSFAAGLGWNEQATTVDDASESDATSADTDEAVTAPNTATYPSLDEERGAGADEEQQRRIAARKLSMDLLEGKASARQRATPSPSPVPVQPRSSSMAMAITVASLVDGPEWSAGKMRATIRRANTLAGPASAASTSSFYAFASWSDVGEKRRSAA